MPEARPVVVAVDGSDESKGALRMGCRVAKGLDAPLLLVAVIPPPPIYPGGIAPMVLEPADLSRSYREVLTAAEQQARSDGITRMKSELIEGPVVESLVEFLKGTNPVLAVLGARGLTGAARLLLGSVSDGVVHHAPCPVLIVRNPAGKRA
jgi:nucleotide-binding universal stress UspA family protein